MYRTISQDQFGYHIQEFAHGRIHTHMYKNSLKKIEVKTMKSDCLHLYSWLCNLEQTFDSFFYISIFSSEIKD